MFLNTYTLQFNLSGGFHGNEYDVEIHLNALADDIKYPSGGLLDSAAQAVGSALGGSDISPKINVLCKSVNLPGKTISTTDFHYRGKKYVVAGEEEYSGTIELEYYNDRELTTRTFFMAWLDEVKKSEKDFYNADIMITPNTKKAAVDLIGSNTTATTFRGVFPVGISDLSLDGTNTTELTTTTVTLAYSYFDSESEKGGLAGLLGL